MGAKQSAPEPPELPRGPAILLQTEVGVIVRVSDKNTGQMKYEHNPRNQTAMTTVLEDLDRNNSSNQQVQVVRPSSTNTALKGMIVYVKKPTVSR